MNTKALVAALALAVSLAGCSTVGRISQGAQDLLVLRVTWRAPAQQAGVLAEAERHVQALDRAIASGDPLRVRAVLLSLEPVYREIYQEVDDPTPEQEAFHARAVSLWEQLSGDNQDRWLELAGAVLIELAKAKLGVPLTNSGLLLQHGQRGPGHGPGPENREQFRRLGV